MDIFLRRQHDLDKDGRLTIAAAFVWNCVSGAFFMSLIQNEFFSTSNISFFFLVFFGASRRDRGVQQHDGARYAQLRARGDQIGITKYNLEYPSIAELPESAVAVPVPLPSFFQNMEGVRSLSIFDPKSNT